jgi:hypothetical protein
VTFGRREPGTIGRQRTTDLEEHRRLWSEAGEIQRQLQELLTSADDGT